MPSPPSTRDLLADAALTAQAQRLAWQGNERPNHEFETEWQARFVPCLLATEASIQAMLDAMEEKRLAA